jgi:dienelactone hydrolase
VRGTIESLRRCSLVAMVFCGVVAVNAGEIHKVEIRTPSPLNPVVPFYYRHPLKGMASGIVLLVPGYNGAGQAMVGDEPGWGKWADEKGLVLVGPTFKTTLEEIQSRKGCYYYPDQWSGSATLSALENIRARCGVAADTIMLFGFSAGAHFVHRFANWKPEKVKAFVAYSAGWWDEPSPKLRQVPALIMCGEEDLRYGATQKFMTSAQALELPWIWRGYSGTDHSMTPAIQRMTEVFLGYCLRQAASTGSAFDSKAPYIGDMQTYEVFARESDGAERVPAEMRVALPDRELAEIWTQER